MTLEIHFSVATGAYNMFTEWSLGLSDWSLSLFLICTSLSRFWTEFKLQYSIPQQCFIFCNFICLDVAKYSQSHIHTCITLGLGLKKVRMNVNANYWLTPCWQTQSLSGTTAHAHKQVPRNLLVECISTCIHRTGHSSNCLVSLFIPNLHNQTSFPWTHSAPLFINYLFSIN